MTRATVVRYRVRADAVDENERLVRDVYAELAEKNPTGLRYRTVRVDECTFVHMALIDGDTNPLDEIDAFAAFTASLGQRCDEGPRAHHGELIGTFG